MLAAIIGEEAAMILGSVFSQHQDRQFLNDSILWDLAKVKFKCYLWHARTAVLLSTVLLNVLKVLVCPI